MTEITGIYFACVSVLGKTIHVKDLEDFWICGGHFDWGKGKFEFQYD